jgi:hypothetical protein
MKKHRHKWSARHYRFGIKLEVRVCIVDACDATTDGKDILYQDGTIKPLSREMRRQMSTMFTLQKSTESGKTNET